jgi:hypothetical protein
MPLFVFTRSQALPGNALSRSSASTRATGSGASGKFRRRQSLGRSRTVIKAVSTDGLGAHPTVLFPASGRLIRAADVVFDIPRLGRHRMVFEPVAFSTSRGSAAAFLADECPFVVLIFGGVSIVTRIRPHRLHHVFRHVSRWLKHSTARREQRSTDDQKEWSSSHGRWTPVGGEELRGGQAVLTEGSGLRFSVFAGADLDLHCQAKSGKN